MYIQAHTYQYIAVAPADALSYSGSASVATIMSNLAMRMGLSLENNGVNVSLSNPTFGGSLVAQMRACARAANIYAQIDQVRSVLAIWPKNGSRSGAPVMVSPQTGLVGYPRFGLRQIQFKTLFNPSLVTGRRVQVQSSLQPACGIFTVIGLDIDVAAEEPNGPWFSTVTAAVIAVLVGPLRQADNCGNLGLNSERKPWRRLGRRRRLVSAGHCITTPAKKYGAQLSCSGQPIAAMSRPAASATWAMRSSACAPSDPILFCHTQIRLGPGKPRGDHDDSATGTAASWRNWQVWW